MGVSLWVLVRAWRSRIHFTLIALAQLRCVMHHKKMHLYGIVVFAFAIQ
jgi:hypothetical protein